MRTADIIINRWQTMEIFEDVHKIAPQLAQNDILDLADEIATLRAENARLTAELAAARDRWKTFVGMMGPIADDCLCMDEPDNDQGENDPSNHSQYCPIYLQAYAEAMAKGTEVPE